MMGSISFWPIFRSHKSVRIERGPKNPTLPQLAAKLVPARLPSTSAAKAAEGSRFQRGCTYAASPINDEGLREAHKSSESDAHDPICFNKFVGTQRADLDIFFGAHAITS